MNEKRTSGAPLESPHTAEPPFNHMDADPALLKASARDRTEGLRGITSFERVEHVLFC